MDIKDSYLHGTVGVVKSISVAADKLSYKLADVAGTTKTVTMPTATQSANGLLSSTDKKKLDSITGPTLSIPYIVGPDTDTTKGTWTGSYSGITAYTDGLTIIYVPKVAGASTTTLNINGLGAKTCHYTGSSNLTTHYAVGTPILLTYVGGYWKRADYDSWTPHVAAYCSTAAATAAKTASCSSYVLTSKTYIHMLITTANTAQSALTMNINSKGAKPIYINGTASSASNYTLPAGTYIVYYDGTNFYFRTDGILPGTIEKATNATSASKVANNLVIKLKSGSTEGTDLYTYNGSAAKTLDIKQGSNITLTAAANSLTIAASDTKVTQTNTTGSASYRVLFSGNANDTTETTTARKSANLLFNPSTGNLTAISLNLNGDIVINDGTNHNRYIKWLYANTDDYGWRIGYLGSQGGDNNDLTFDSHRKTEGWASALYFKHTTLNAHFAGIVNAPTFQGNLDGTYVNKLTGYSKASSGSNVVATDTLNVALGKIEYKAHFAYEWITNVTASDTDEYINKWGEIVGFLDSVKEGTDILDEFVTRKTALTITGLKTLQSESSTTGVSLILKNNGWAGGMSTAMDFYNGRSYTVPNARIQTNMVGDGKAGGTLIFYTQTKHASTNPNPNGLTERLRIDDNGLTKITGSLTVTSNITGAKFITSGGTSSLFVKGDGSLDSNKYLINTHATHTSAYYRTTTVNGTNYAFWSHTSSAAFTIYAPTTAGTKGLVLTSNGSGAPVWSNSVGTANNGVFYIEGTGTTAGTWLGSHTGITSYYVGLTIAYKIPIAGASTTTLNINSLGAKTCYINTSKLTTHYGVGSVAILVYDGTYFRAADYWDGNNYAKVRQYMYDSSNAEYPLLFRYATTATTTYVTDYTAYDSVITINPSTNTITATNFKGTATLVACTATTDNVTRPIVLTNTSSKLYYTTKATINYSTGNITAPTFTGALKGTADKSKVLSNYYSSRQTTIKPGITGDGSMILYKCTSTCTDTDEPGDGHILHFNWDSTGGWDSLLYIAGNSPATMKVRGMSKGVWGDWATVLTSVNYTAYLGYIGTTAVLSTSKALALTGITNLTMSGNLTITPGNTDTFINFSYNSGTTHSWRLGYLGTGSGDTNYFVVQSAKAAGTSWNNVIRLGNETLDAAFGGNVYPLVTNTQTLGTSSLRWASVYAVTGSFLSNVVSTTTTGDAVKHAVTNSNGSVELLVSLNRGLYDRTNNKWIIYVPNGTTNVLVPTWASKGSSTLPVYFDKNGNPVACTAYSGLFTAFTTNSTKISATIGGTTLTVLAPSIAYYSHNTEAASSSTNPTVRFEGTKFGTNTGMYMTANYNDPNTPCGYGNIINLMGSGGGLLLCGWEGSYKTGNLYYRSHRDNLETGGWTPWKQVAFTDSNISGSAAKLTSTTVVSAKAFSLSNASWTDTGYTFASLVSGTYAVQVTSGTNLVASGIMSVYKNLSDTAGDEIPLHVYGTAGWRPYLRTYNNKLLISSNDASATSRTVTIKIALIL